MLALCDIDPKRLHGASQQFSTPRATVSFGELLAMPDLDIIDICTPPGAASRAVAGGTDGRQAGNLREATGRFARGCRPADRHRAVSTGRLLPVFQYCFGNGLQKAKHIIASGIAGKPSPARWRPLRRDGRLLHRALAQEMQNRTRRHTIPDTNAMPSIYIPTDHAMEIPLP